MIISITWDQIQPIWSNHLWTNRNSLIEPTSAMCYLDGYNMQNMKMLPSFFGYLINNKIVGVNSGHACPTNTSYRSRGLWVDPLFRNRGIGQSLLNATIKQGQLEGYTMIWSYPRQSSWKTYQSVGFTLTSDWTPSETSDANAYCLGEFLF